MFADGTYGQGWNGAHWFKLADGTYKFFSDPTTAPTGSTEMGVLGLFYGGGMSQFWAELIGCVTCFITLAVITYVVFKVIGVVLGGHRPTLDIEIGGLDIPEMGCYGYSGMVMDKEVETPHPKGYSNPAASVPSSSKTPVSTH